RGAPAPARRVRRDRLRATADPRPRAGDRGTARRRAGRPRCARARRAGWVWAVPRARIVCGRGRLDAAHRRLAAADGFTARDRICCGGSLPPAMEIREVMTESVVTAPPDAPVRHVAELMRERNVGSVVL